MALCAAVAYDFIFYHVKVLKSIAFDKFEKGKNNEISISLRQKIVYNIKNGF